MSEHKSVLGFKNLSFQFYFKAAAILVHGITYSRHGLAGHGFLPLNGPHKQVSPIKSLTAPLIVPVDATATYQACLPLQFFYQSITTSVVGGNSIASWTRQFTKTP